MSARTPLSEDRPDNRRRAYFGKRFSLRLSKGFGTYRHRLLASKPIDPERFVKRMARFLPSDLRSNRLRVDPFSRRTYPT
jgi:hypothetical protein